jgi:hypothetical protein
MNKGLYVSIKDEGVHRYLGERSVELFSDSTGMPLWLTVRNHMFADVVSKEIFPLSPNEVIPLVDYIRKMRKNASGTKQKTKISI